MLKSFKHTLLIGIIFFVLSTCAFFLYYIHNINIYGDFSIEVYQNEENISDQFEIIGVSFFGRENLLEYKEGKWDNETWHFHKLKLSKSTDGGEGEILSVFAENNGNRRLAFEGKIPLETNIIIKSLAGDDYFFSKFFYFVPISWLDALRLIILFLFIVMFNNSLNLTSFKLRISDCKLRIIIYMIVIIAGLIPRFFNPVFTILAFDYTGHILPILKFFLYGEFYHYNWAYPYPAFLVGMLSVFNDINSVVIFQHLLSSFFFIGFILFAEAFFISKIKTDTKRAFFAVVLIFVLDLIFTNGNLISYEKMLHHEGTIIPSSIALFMVLFVYFESDNSRFRTILFSLCLFLVFLLTLLHYRLTAGLILVSLIIVLREIIRFYRISGRYIYIPIVIFMSIYGILFLPEKYLENKYDKTASGFPYVQFVYSNAYIVNDLISKGYSVLPEHDTIELKNQLEEAFLAENKEYFRILGYNFDDFKYRSALPSFENYLVAKLYPNADKDSIAQYLNADELYSKEFNNYYKSWAWKILKSYPFIVLQKALRQSTYILFNPNYNYMAYETDIIITNPEKREQLFCQFDFLSKRFNFKSGKEAHISFPSQWSYFSFISELLVRFLFLLSIVYVLILILRRKFSGALYSLSIVILLSIITVAVLHTFDIIRYMHNLSPLIMLFILLSAYELLKSKSSNVDNNC